MDGAMTVTDIVYGDNKKYLIYLNDAPAFELYKSEIKSCLIEKGQDLSYEQQQYILEQVIGKRATKRAMHILEKHDKTEQQLREKLSQGNYPKACIDMAIEYVKSYGYINDYSYAERYIAYRGGSKSCTMLKKELIAKGIASDIINDVLEQEEVDEVANVVKLLRKKFTSVEKVTKEKKDKLTASLMRKGFSYRTIEQAFRKLEETSEEWEQ